MRKYSLENIKTISSLGELNKIAKHASKTYIENHVKTLFEKSLNAGVDLFEVKNLLYRYHNDKYDSNENTILKNLQLKVKVECVNFV